MEVNIDNQNMEDCNFYDKTSWSNVINRATELNPSSDNINALKEIQEIIQLYENKTASLDDVLSRVLEFYGRFVPYK
jgi:hypothetical protein